MIERWKRRLSGIFPHTIQTTILLSFSLVAVVTTLSVTLALYQLLAARTVEILTESSRRVLRQTASNLEDYLSSMRRLSDAITYDVLKDVDLGQETADDELALLYEANKESLVGVALYTAEGELLSASPVAVEKENLDVTGQEWYRRATSQMENLHFSTPHVQNLFDDPSFRYTWVISLSRMVDLTRNGRPVSGVLLVDMSYSAIVRMLEEANAENRRQYVYLCDGDGDIIYHPRNMQIGAGLAQENNRQVAEYLDGVHEEVFGREKRVVIVETISYTGWKMVSMIPAGSFRLDLTNSRYLMLMILAVALLALLLVNRYVAGRLSRPLILLNDSISELEAGGSEVYIGGTQEVEHLGRTLQDYANRNHQLMQDIIVEQEEKLRSELDALQSQINPHFLYNTLDSITWMIEGGRREDAVYMVSELARLFRISLSRGQTIIRMEEELQHAESYMNIQKARFKNAFSMEYHIDPAVKDCCTVKLIVQPILENAIYYGVKDMEEEGRIRLTAKREDEELKICVEDNGFGIPPEELELLLSDTRRVHYRGSGVGLINVQNRIVLRFGTAYGLKIESEPDVGTRVTIHLPAIPYTEENRQMLEKGQLPEGRTGHET